MSALVTWMMRQWPLGQLAEVESWGAGCAAVLMTHSRLEKWVDRNLIKFHERKYIYEQVKTCEVEEIDQERTL